MANAIAKTTTVNYFKQWKFEFKEPGLHGKVKAVKPEEHVKVKIKEFRLFETSATLTLAIDALYEFKGEVKAGDKTIAVKGNGDIFHVITARAAFRQEDNKLIITPRIERMKLEVKRLKTEPADLPGAEKLLKATIAKNEHRFLKDLNDWLTKNSIKSE